MRMTIDGGCHCGSIRYRAEVNPDHVVVCHCTDCQTMSGAPYRANVRVLLDDFDLQGPPPRRYRKVGDSGNAVVTTFCDQCGTALYSHREGADFIYLRLGSVNQRAALPPKAQGFCRSAMAWTSHLADVPEIPSPPALHPKS